MRIIVALTLSVLIAVSAVAEEVEEEKITYSYLQLKPSIVTNYGGVGKLRYFKSDISLRLEEANKQRVTGHEPYIRSVLVSIFSRQDEESLTTREGKSSLQQEALEAIQHILVEEEGEPLVDGVLFTNFIIQK
ncbi:MAG: flagellar basal body-associated FliL family protein [Gammaproteobacteria bacterium]|nr:flagellar basal body-associated FliL family protein [Gammaproteobacteria bacterium]